MLSLLETYVYEEAWISHYWYAYIRRIGKFWVLQRLVRHLNASSEYTFQLIACSGVTAYQCNVFNGTGTVNGTIWMRFCYIDDSGMLLCVMLMISKTGINISQKSPSPRPSQRLNHIATNPPKTPRPCSNRYTFVFRLSISQVSQLA